MLVSSTSLLWALSTSSPFWHGVDTGLRSFRLSVFDGMPRTGLPEVFESWADYQRHAQVLVNAGVMEDASKLWWDLRPSARYPTLEMAFEGSRPVVPGVRSTARLQRRRRQAVSDRWAMLPQTYAFLDPLFSTGIAWSLLGVERLAGILAKPTISQDALIRYEALLIAEANQQQALLEAAYLARRDFEVFRDLSFLYFAAVSFEEIRQRLFDDQTDQAAWSAFLGATDSEWQTRVKAARGVVATALADGSGCGRRRFHRWVMDAISERNMIGLGQRSSHLYGVDLDSLVESSGLLGLTTAEMEHLLPRLRGATSPGT